MNRHIGKYLLTMLLFVASSVSTWAQRELSVDDKNVDNKNLIYDGIDVSSYQEDIDWSATAQDKNIKFVYVKATEGSSYRSRHYEANIENARKEGVRVGSYHYLTTHTSMQRQFENFISVVKKEDQDLVPLIDIEEKKMWTPQEMADSLIKFADLLEDYYGCRPMIYTGSAFYNSYLAGRIKGYPLFIARYSKYQPHLNGGAKWVLWQFSERGRISGIDHYVDLCRFNTGRGLNDILMKKGGKKKSYKETETTPPARKTEKTVEKPVPAAKKEPEMSEKDKEKLAKEREKQLKEQQKAKEKAEKEAKKKAEEKARLEAEAARQKRIQQEKEAKERQKAKEKAEKEKAKQLKAQQEQAAKEAKARQEQAEKAAKEKQAQAEKAAKEKAAKEAQAAKEKAAKQAQAEKAAKEAAAKSEKKASAPADVFKKNRTTTTTTTTNTSKTKTSTSTTTTKAKVDSAAKKQQTTPKTTQSANQKAKAAGKRVNGSSADND